MDTQLFDLLKQYITQTYQTHYPDCVEPIGTWKGKEIKRFQADLAEQTQGQVSEKWFYTYFKNEAPDKLPRIDVLNLLAQYVGYKNWEAFAQAHQQIITEESITLPPPPASSSRRFMYPIVGAALAITLLLAGSGWWWVRMMQTPLQRYTLCFENADSHDILRGTTIEVQWLKPDESPTILYADTTTGCLELEAPPNQKIVLAITAPYYKKDTLVRSLSTTDLIERIPLYTDDYALMLHYFSTTDLTDWKKRRAQLDAILADEAQIVQVYGADATQGIALYNKQEFIDKLTMPLETLKNIEVLATKYDQHGQINHIRFR